MAERAGSCWGIRSCRGWVGNVAAAVDGAYEQAVDAVVAVAAAAGKLQPSGQWLGIHSVAAAVVAKRSQVAEPS